MITDLLGPPVRPPVLIQLIIILSRLPSYDIDIEIHTLIIIIIKSRRTKLNIKHKRQEQGTWFQLEYKKKKKNWALVIIMSQPTLTMLAFGITAD